MTMKTPEMEVVRFNESDVIVASGNSVPVPAQSFVLQNWKNGNLGDATVDGEGKEGALNWLNKIGDGHTFQYKQNAAVDAKKLYDYEETGTILDGIYVKDANSNNWWCQ